MRPTAAALDDAGFPTLNLTYPSLTAKLDTIVTGLAVPIKSFADATGGPVHFIGHSLGGLVIRRLLATHRPAQLGKVIMLGTPNNGSEMADLAYRLHVDRIFLGKVGRFLCTRRTVDDEALLGPVDYPLGIIAGNRPDWPNAFAPLFRGAFDGKVTVNSTQLRGMTDHIVMPVAHDALPKRADVHGQIIAFLRDGTFLRP